MATKCAAPASLILPKALSKVFYSGIPFHLRPSPSFLPRPRVLQQPRQFSSTIRFHNGQEQSRHISKRRKSADDRPSAENSDHSPKSPSNPAKKSRHATKPNKYRKAAKETDTKGIKFNSPNQEFKTNDKHEDWQIQKQALGKKFPAGWNPPKKLSPDALDGIRQLHASAPDQFTTAVLAEEFKVSPESIRRILKSKWRPSGDEIESRRKRWEKRHDRIWSHMAELGLRPMTKSALPWADSKTLYEDEEEDDKK